MKEKNLTKIMKVLAILAICLISFGGFYLKDNNRYKNAVKDYKIASDLTGYRQLVFEVSDANVVLDSEGNTVGNTDSFDDDTIAQNSYEKTETKVNSDEDKNLDNYKKVKSIIEKRLKGLGVTNYNISIQEETGKIFLNIAENDETDHVVSNLLQVGKFQIRDSEDEEKVIIKGTDLKKSSAVYNTSESGTTVYLQLELNKQATKTFADITANEYKTLENTTSESSEVTEESETTAEVEVSDENGENVENVENNENTADESETEAEESAEEEKETQKQIILEIDGNKMVTTSFDEPIKDGVIDLSMGASSKDSSTISDSLKSTSTIALILNSGEMPLTYKVTENQYVKQDVTSENLKNVIYVATAVLAILAIVMIVKFKEKGFLGAVSFVGFEALYLLLIRYTNVAISIESIVAIAIISLIAYLETINLLKINEPDQELKNKEFTNEYKSFISKIIPAGIISVVFSFMAWEAIATFGMVAFWGIVLVLIYLFLITKKVID